MDRREIIAFYSEILEKAANSTKDEIRKREFSLAFGIKCRSTTMPYSYINP